jgi:hypothetical protein
MGMPVFRISDAAALPNLLADLTSNHDCLAEVIGPNRVSVSILGSYNADAMDLEVELRIRAWQAAQISRGVEVGIDREAATS